MTDEEFQNALDIDPDRLPHEWLRQPKLYFLASEELANARSKVDSYKSALEVAEAEMRLDIIKRPSRYNVSEKQTVAEINAAVIRTMANSKHVRRLRNAKHRMDVIQAFVNALDHKKKALENHVTLFVHNWYAEPREPKEARGYVEQRQRENMYSKGVPADERGKARKRKKGSK